MPSSRDRLHLYVLASGSKGNCSIVAGPGGLVMIDDGLSRREVLSRMEACGLRPHDVRALVLTHEHGDHTGGIAVWHRAFPVELFASEGSTELRRALRELPFNHFAPGETLELAEMRVDTFSTSHDVANPVGFRFSCDGDAIGYATDTGIMTAAMRSGLRGARIIALEANHDVPMLACGPYPRYLQDRIRSDRGHLSNEQAAGAAAEVVDERTEHLIAMHISQENNRPSLAVRSIAETLGAELDDELGSTATLERNGGLPSLHIRAAGQNRPVAIL